MIKPLTNKKLGELCGFVRGPFGGSLKKSSFVEQGIAVYEQQHAIYNQFNVIRYFITNEKYNEMKRFELSPGDLIMSCSGTMGKVAIVPDGIQKGIINQALLKLSPFPELYIQYLKYWMESEDFQRKISEKSVGAAIKNVASVKILKEIELPTPPLAEQQRIVAILDKAFAAIDKAKANAEQNLINSKELFESYLQSVFENKGDDWEEKPFGKVCEIVGGSQPPKPTFVYEPKDDYIRLIQVRDYRTSKYITYIPKNKAKKFCSITDIMIGRYGPPIFGIFRGLEGAYNVALMKALPSEELFDKEFFYWFLKTNNLKKFVEKSSKRAAGQDGVRKEVLYTYPTPIPPLSEQLHIVHNLVALSDKTKKLEAIYKQKINDLEELKKSILQKAFNGELTKDVI